MSEKNTWTAFRENLSKYGHLQRIENMVGVGMCDVNVCIRGTESWVELKQLDAWPVKPDTLVLLPHYTPQQRVWQRRRGEAGGRVYVLLQVGSEYALFGWAQAVAVLGRVSRSILLRNALLYEKGFPTAALLREFTSITPYSTLT